MLTLVVPRDRTEEREWILSVVLGDFLGLPYRVKHGDVDRWKIRHDGRELRISDSFFATARESWFQPQSLPLGPIPRWDFESLPVPAAVVESPIPLLYGQPGFEIDGNGDGELGLDVLGSAFFMLSRYEEMIMTTRDRHDRFPASASSAAEGGFLGRPIVDEYTELLWAAMRRLWPGLERRNERGQVFVTCDVDRPYSSYVRSVSGTLRKMTADAFKRRSLRSAWSSWYNAVCSRRGQYHAEPKHTFNWIMQVNERVGNRVAFNFLAGRSNPLYDGVYSLDETRIRELLVRIHERGHEIGLHGSYETYRSSERLLEEVSSLRRVLAEEGIDQSSFGSRQHYLRWSTPITARSLEEAGVQYDATLGYAEEPGFRCGTSREYPLFDLERRCPLELKERPLILMEASVLHDAYLGMGCSDEALHHMLTLKERACRLGGSFTLLWHNCNLSTARERELFEELIR